MQSIADQEGVHDCDTHTFCICFQTVAGIAYRQDLTQQLLYRCCTVAVPSHCCKVLLLVTGLDTMIVVLSPYYCMAAALLQSCNELLLLTGLVTVVIPLSKPAVWLSKTLLLVTR